VDREGSVMEIREDDISDGIPGSDFVRARSCLNLPPVKMIAASARVRVRNIIEHKEMKRVMSDTSRTEADEFPSQNLSNFYSDSMSC